MSAAELVPCPFCGSVRTQPVDQFVHFVRCQDCDTEGPCGFSEDQAVEKWNTRVFPGVEPCQANPEQQSGCPQPFD